MIRTRLLPNPNEGHSHFHCNFFYKEYDNECDIHYQSEDYVLIKWSSMSSKSMLTIEYRMAMSKEIF